MIRQNFNADWTVEKGDGNSRMNSFLGNTQTKTVHLPYDAMIHEARTPDTKNGAQTGFYPGGEYIFQKHFTAPQAWQGQPVSLVFEGVYQTALVYLNGWLLTRNVNGYAEFTVEAGPYLKYGADNLLKVIADNSLEPNSRWYTGSGIYRPVRLLVGNKVYLPQDTMRITTREADEGFALLDVTAQVQSASTVTERVTLQQTICREGTAVLTDRQNLLLQPGESRTVSFRYCVDSPALWSPENPNLYTSTMQVLEDEEELDREETGFGPEHRCSPWGTHQRADRQATGCLHPPRQRHSWCSYPARCRGAPHSSTKGSGLQRHPLLPSPGRAGAAGCLRPVRCAGNGRTERRMECAEKSLRLCSVL